MSWAEFKSDIKRDWRIILTEAVMLGAVVVGLVWWVQ